MKKIICFIKWLLVVLVIGMLITLCTREYMKDRGLISPHSGKKATEQQFSNLSDRISKIENTLKSNDADDMDYRDDTENNDISEVRAENERLNKKLSKLKQQIGVAEDSEYMRLKFKRDGKFYKNSNPEVKFYSNPDCGRGDKIKGDLTFLSKDVDTITNDADITVYCVVLDTGKVCFCTKYPSFIEVE